MPVPIRCVAATLALFVVVSCGGRNERRFEQTLSAATLALRNGQLPEAQALAEQGVSLTKAQPESAWAWRFQLLRGEVLVARAKLAEVTPLLERPLPSGAKFDPLRIRQQYVRALAEIAQGHLREARDTLKALNGAAAASDLSLDVEVLTGQLDLRLKQWAEGETRLLAVVSRARAESDRYHEVWALNDLGMARLVRSRWDEALPWFEQVLGFKDAERLTYYAAALNNAGICYSNLGQFERAVAVQRRAIDMHKQGGRTAAYESALGSLGSTFVFLGDTRQGLDYLQQAFDVARDAKLTADAALWAGNLASAHIGLGNWNEAERFNDEARQVRAADRSGKPVYNTLNAAQIASGRGQANEAQQLYEGALRDAVDEPSVQWDANAGLARLAVAAGQHERAARHFELALDVIEKTRAGLLKTDYKLSYLSRLVRFYQDYVDALVDNTQAARALEIADSSHGRVLAEKQGGLAPTRKTAVEFQRIAAASHSVLLSYWLTPARSYAWVVTAAGIKSVTLPPAKEIETLVREYQATIANALADPLAAKDTAGDKLFHMLVEPIAASIPKDATVVVVPDGALHGLNFETLPVDGPRRHYWVEDVEVQVAPSLASLTVAPVRRAGPPSLLVIGNPTPRPPEFPALGYASAEMASIAGHFDAGHVTQMETAHASPASYRDANPGQFSYVHFTAHATANVESPLDSAVILSGPEGAYKLYARDVADQPLHAELVTVSACKSAGERAFSGEGLVGFSWAFLRAGAERVVAGLWDVDDRSTATLMDRFYEGVAAGTPPGGALRRAKLAQLRAGGVAAKPYYWAPFEMFTVVVARPVTQA